MKYIHELTLLIADEILFAQMELLTFCEVILNKQFDGKFFLYSNRLYLRHRIHLVDTVDGYI